MEKWREISGCSFRKFGDCFFQSRVFLFGKLVKRLEVEYRECDATTATPFTDAFHLLCGNCLKSRYRSFLIQEDPNPVGVLPLVQARDADRQVNSRRFSGWLASLPKIVKFIQHG